ncbi:hypothetical protein NLG97_g8404 [Lecanicillium saksenae]|uniref:Uncharacterized protein n=1 Tax=Lecanicillium saksenae TaxID=468837 RepID=A0ACC1QMV6_9HYPO|nr:hypothetical protein NLG97_g8404 [Lecanicillium saksenae]
MKLGIAFCERCNRPCAGIKALQVHSRTGLCGSPPVPLNRFGREYCLYCGQRFLGGPTGLRYHIEHTVCGQYTDEHADALTSLFADAEAVQRRLRAAAETPRAAPAASQASPGQSPGPSDPYAVLTPNERIAFDAEMAKADQKYADNLKKARELPPDQQKAEFARVKNIYNNKQSVTRKKYGIRLRDRKSRADVEGERNRMLSSRQNTPGSTGTPAHSEAALTPTTRGERDSISSQATTPRATLFSEAGNGLSGPTGTAELTNQTATSATSPAVSHRSPPATASGAARPMPMSIAGSYTAPVRPPDRPMNNGNDRQPIEIDDDDAKMDTAADESNTEMEVDEQDGSME